MPVFLATSPQQTNRKLTSFASDNLKNGGPKIPSGGAQALRTVVLLTPDVWVRKNKSRLCVSFRCQAMTQSLLIILTSIAALAAAMVELWTKLNMTERFAFVASYFRKRRANRILGGGGVVRRVVRSFLRYGNRPRNCSWRALPAKASKRRGSVSQN